MMLQKAVIMMHWKPGSLQVSSVELERACVENVPDVLEAAAVACPTPGALLQQSTWLGGGLASAPAQKHPLSPASAPAGACAQ
jgi:hypothetical protein